MSSWIGVVADWMLRSDDPIPYLVEVTPEELATHALVIGATGSGKTVLMHHMIKQDLDRGSSVCVFDIRGDLVNAVVELCVRANVPPDKVRIIDLREKVRPFGFNPLYGAGQAYYRALAVLDVIAKESESWGVQLQHTFTNALLLLSEAQAPITELESLFYDRGVLQRLLPEVTTDSVVAFWRNFDALSSDRKTALAMPVLNKVTTLMSTPTVRRILGHPSPIELGKHLATPGSVLLVSLAVDELHATARMMGSLILSAVCREIFARVDVPEANRNPVRCYVDECHNFSMRDFESILAEGRRFKFSVVLAHQHTAQLSPRMRSMILGNVGVKVVFRCGHEDSATLNKDIFGKPNTYAFPDLPTGFALLWRKDDGVVEVEVNEPLLPNVGQRSPSALEYLSRVYEFAGTPQEDRAAHLAPSARPAMTKPRGARGLEDWLCD